MGQCAADGGGVARRGRARRPPRPRSGAVRSRRAARRGAHPVAIERDLLVSDAILSYADALAEGAMPVGARPEIEDLHPPPVDVIAVVGAALTAPDPAATIEALAT